MISRTTKRSTLSLIILNILSILSTNTNGKSDSDLHSSSILLNTPLLHQGHFKILEPSFEKSTNFTPSVSPYDKSLHGFNDAIRDFLETFNGSRNLSDDESISRTLRDLNLFPTDLLKSSFEKGEEGWLSRQKSIESIWINDNGAADPKSGLGTAFAFNAPNAESLLLSNTSLILEYASRAFLERISEEEKNIKKRAKRAVFSSFRYPTANLNRVDITPFMPAQEYIANCGVNEELAACDPSSPYRTYSGYCNNLRNPLWGKSVLPFDRMLPPLYDDGISVPRSKSVLNKPLPSPRYISSTVHVDVSHLSHRHTLMFMQYAQFLDHDITFTPVTKGPRGAILNCRQCDSRTTVHPECWPIPVPPTDSYYPSSAAWAQGGKGYCIPFTRSLPGQQRLGAREQINQNSPILDSSHIYGENYCKAMSLRSGRGMLNATGQSSKGGKVLMPQITEMKECKSPSGYCFYAGDPRASEQPALAALHTIFLRQHNRLASSFVSINPHWSDDKIYQESRRIIGAMNQHLVYAEFLPRLLGPAYMSSYGLNIENEGYYTRYDANCPPTAYNEFATAAFRFGHSLIRPMLSRMDGKYQGMANIPLRDGFFNSDMLYKSFMVDEVIRGLIGEPMEQLDPFITKEITNHLFEDKKKQFSGMDLIALNLHRGRDHGMRGYNAYRVACDLKRAENFNELGGEVPADVIARLAMAYEHVDDIDLFTGALVERPVAGGLVGPTMACIIGSQFKRLRQCDRFWYETNDPLLQFSPRQLAEIKKTTLSKILCDNFDTEGDIQKNAFDAPHNILNPRLPCSRLPTLNLEEWRERSPTPNIVPNNPTSIKFPSPICSTCKIGEKEVRVGEGGLLSPCVSCVCTPQGTKCASLRITSCSRLLQEAKRDEIWSDKVCMAQCGQFLSPTPHLTPPPHHRFPNSLFNIINGV